MKIKTENIDRALVGYRKDNRIPKADAVFTCQRILEAGEGRQEFQPQGDRFIVDGATGTITRLDRVNGEVVKVFQFGEG